MNMKIHYEDKYLIVADKEAGVASQKDPSGRPDMVTLLSEHCRKEVFCVHRLDTATSGIMVYAKDSRTAGKLSAALSHENGAVKEYVCICRGECDDSGKMEDLLYHDRQKNKAFVVKKERSGVKKASLSYKSLAYKDDLSLVRVTLHTGRTHQIRVQFASRKMPLVGDGKYGSRDNRPLALHCLRLSFIHPMTNETLDTVSYPTTPWYGFESFDKDDI